MARARATEQTRPRSKVAQIEEITRGIEQFQDILVSIEDFGREGFPYRDAARAKAELQLRECVRRIFGEKSPEFQTYRNYKLRTTNKGETAQSVAAVKSLIRTLEEKKLGLQGLKPPAPEPAVVNAPAATPHMTLVPPTAHITIPSQPVSHAPMTVSVAMTTNLGSPVAGQTSPIQPASAPPILHSPLSSLAPPIQPSPASPAAQAPTTPEASPLVVNPVQTSPAPRAVEAPPTDSVSSTPQLSTPVAEHQASSIAGVSVTPPSARDLPVYSSSTDTNDGRREPTAEPAEVKPTVQSPLPEDRSPSRTKEQDPQDPMESIRKVCLRFHAVTRQLRLRKDYRATLEVDDEYDLQDLLCALLKVEFDEVGTDEWTPPYTAGAPRTTFLIHREQIAVVAKKTRPGLSTKELTDQVAADSSRYATRDKCTTLFCFIYDPEGRIGSPKRLETDLTSVSDRYMIEVLVAPK